MVNMEELCQRQRKELRDLVNTITGLKKQATKKTRKGVLSKCQELEDNLKRKHAEEMALLNGDEQAVTEVEVTPETLLAQVSLEENENKDNEEPPLSKPKRRNRQKERLAIRKAETERIRNEAKNEAANSIDYRQIEMDSMNQLLSLHGLSLYEIKPDGHCLFAAIADQLLQRRGITKTVQQLRDLAADYILSHKDDFIPYLFDEVTNTMRDVTDYCQELRATAMWGSDMEVLALARVFDCCISIYMAGASTIRINEDAKDEPELMLGYYKHSYGLGEHYNSLRDASSTS
ncbi:OTU2 [Candida oxycetoniae]|uniref:OTU2 n=1 Tax=Candida oxycetoniae TaxID=497107 RepID=A0AAI9WYC9_9ASCO|nr:OTU2 [Candida oxycetoniae]KAI3404894.2 OTU2 [Candida oxycetoniae]